MYMYYRLTVDGGVIDAIVMTWRALKWLNSAAHLQEVYRWNVHMYVRVHLAQRI